MRSLICLLLPSCIACGSPFVGPGVVTYQVKNGDRAVVQEVIGYIEKEMGHRVSFVENNTTDIPDLVVTDDDRACGPGQNAYTTWGEHYWVDINFCPGNWSPDYVNKNVIYAHELMHAMGVGHTDKADCIMHPSAKLDLEMCPKEKKLLADILEGKVKAEPEKDF